MDVHNLNDEPFQEIVSHRTGFATTIYFIPLPNVQKNNAVGTPRFAKDRQVIGHQMAGVTETSDGRDHLLTLRSPAFLTAFDHLFL